MKHVLFAEFNDPSQARAAVSELEGAGVRRSRCNLNVHTGSSPVDDNEERPMHETDARSGILIGLVAAALIGALMGWLVTGPLELFHVSIGMGVMTGIALGLAIGFIGGAISGAMNPNRSLEKIEKHADRHNNVVATIEVEGVDQEESVKRVFARHGARVKSRTI
jgi:hypothetical protein